MRLLDPKRLHELAALSYLNRLSQLHGPEGPQRFGELLGAVQRIGTVLPFDIVEVPLTVFMTLNADERPLENGECIVLHDLTTQVGEHMTLQVLDDDELLLHRGDPPDPAALCTRAVVYRFERKDLVLLEGEPNALPRTGGWPSEYTVPTFTDLDECLDFYARRARTSSCDLLRACWYKPDDRLVLVNEPEKAMRDSLHAHLSARLRGHERVVAREAEVNPTRPVNIEVTWPFSVHRALIEIKWMGRNVNRAGNNLSMDYGPERAREGSRQLVELPRGVQDPQSTARAPRISHGVRRTA